MFKIKSERGEIGDAGMAFIAIFVAGILMGIFPLLATADRTDDVSQQVVQSAVDDLAAKAASIGKVTQDDYDSFIDKLVATGNSYDVEIEVQKLDETSRKKTTVASQSKVGEGNSYIEYTSQIMEEMSKKGEYDMKAGDVITVTAKNTNKTIAQSLKKLAYDVTGSNTFSVYAQSTKMVSVNAK